MGDHHVMMTVDSVMDPVMTVDHEMIVDHAMIVDQETVLATVEDLAVVVETETAVVLAMIAAAVTVTQEVANSGDVMKEEMINGAVMIEIWMETGEGISCYVIEELYLS